ncbi:MAG: hypothetical protein JXR19_04190 [Bacteroidia bacterium]
MKQNRILIILGVVALLLLIPLIAMQFTDEVNWNLFDFVVAAVLLLVAAFVISLAWNKAKYRLLTIFAIILLFALLWAELAVGLFGTPWAGS